MNSRAIFWLAWREPSMRLALGFGLLGLLLVPFGNTKAYSVWMAVPTFLGVAAFFMPPTSWQRTLPIRRSEIVAARLLAALAMVWLFMVSAVLLLAFQLDGWTKASSPLAFGGLLTATLTMAWTAYSRPSRWTRLAAIVAATITGVAALWFLPLAGGIVAVALGSIWLWAGSLLGEFERKGKVDPGWVWLLVRSRFSWRLLFQIPFAVFVGSAMSWAFLPLVVPRLLPIGRNVAWLTSLPLSRRALLWGILGPVLVVPLLIGALVGFHENATTLRLPGEVGPSVPLDYYVDTPGENALIWSPWGEPEQPLVLRLPGFYGAALFVYNPYWVGSDNSERFAAWQLSRLTRDIYGTPLTKQAFAAALNSRQG